MGSWLLYGLGTENQNLPGFVVMCPNGYPIQESQNWQSAFLPGIYQGTYVDTKNTAIEKLIANIRNKSNSSKQQARQLELLRAFNADHAERRANEAALESRIQSFELAYRMQSDAAQMIDFSTETQATREMYGVDQKETKSYGSKCLLARRLIESGVRYVQVYSDGEWDAHSNLTENHTGHCRATDIPIAGLLTDLKERGLIDSTLVIWGGEFGRMPVSQGKDGRDHNPQGFMAWMAGAGIKGGTSFGETDEIGYKAVVDPVTVHDLHATMMHLLGMDHKRLTFLHNGREYRLTDVAGEVLHKILA